MIHVPINYHLNPMKSGGEFRLVTHNPDGSIGQDTGWFPNLLLDLGLIQMTTQSSWSNNFHIGESNAAPNVTQTALVAWLAVDSANLADINVNLGNPDYQGQTTRTRRFNAGAIRTVREIGVTQEATNTNMSIRALVTPEINQSDEQILDASYRFTTWPSLIDGTGITNIFGDDYDYTVRMGTVQNLTNTFDSYVPKGTVGNQRAYDGDIGTINEIPSGAGSNSSAFNITSQGSGFCNYTLEFGLDNGNFGSGIRSIGSAIVGGGAARVYIQVEFRNRGEGTGALDSAIPKNATREISFDLGITWDRH